MTKKAQLKAKKAVAKPSAKAKPALKAGSKQIFKQVLRSGSAKDLDASTKKLVKAKADLPAEVASDSIQLRKPMKGVKAPKALKAGAKAGSKPAGKSTASRAHRGEMLCRENLCENLPTSGGYCRLHYIKNWKKIKKRELILKEGKLNRYIEELVNKYPDKYIEAIRQDLSTEEDFAKTIGDLELDETAVDYDAEGPEGVEGLIPEIRPDVDDEGEF